MHDNTNGLEVYVTINPSMFEDIRFKKTQQEFLKITPEQVEELMRKQDEIEKKKKKLLIRLHQ